MNKVVAIILLFNSLFSDEFSANMKIGEELKFKNGLIKFNKIETFEEKNYKSIIANFDILDIEDSITLNPASIDLFEANTKSSTIFLISSVFSSFGTKDLSLYGILLGQTGSHPPDSFSTLPPPNHGLFVEAFLPA